MDPSLLGTSGKAHVQLLRQRVRPVLLGSLHMSQCGFRPSADPVLDHDFTLPWVMELARAHKAPLHAAFVYLSKVLLRARGVHPALVACMQ
jgi:hypothetical protein